MNFIKSLLLTLCIVSSNSTIWCYTFWVRNHSSKIIDAEIRLDSANNTHAYRITPGEERKIAVAGAHCVRGINIRDNASKAVLGRWEWDKRAYWGESPISVISNTGDQKPCGSNVWGFHENGAIAHVGDDPGKNY